MSGILSRIAVMTAILAATTAAAQGPAIAAVNMEKVFNNYYKTARADAALKQQESVYEGHAKGLAKEVESARQKRDEMREKSLNVALPKKVRQNCAKEAKKFEERYQEKRDELRSFMEKKRGELQKDYMGKRKDIVKDITEYVRSYAEKKDYDYVFDSSGFTSNMIPVLIYAAPSTDVTDTILSDLNRGHEDELNHEDEE